VNQEDPRLDRGYGEQVGVGLIKTRPEYVPAQAQASYSAVTLSLQLPPSAATITFDLTLACSSSRFLTRPHFCSRASVWIPCGRVWTRSGESPSP